MLSNGGALAASAFQVALRRFPRVANACEKTSIFPATQQEPKLLLIGQFIHVTSLAFTWHSLVHLEGLAFCNSKVILQEFSSRYKTLYHLLYRSIILFSIYFLLYPHIGVRLMDICGICDLLTKFYQVTSPVS